MMLQYHVFSWSFRKVSFKRVWLWPCLIKNKNFGSFLANWKMIYRCRSKSCWSRGLCNWWRRLKGIDVQWSFLLSSSRYRPLRVLADTICWAELVRKTLINFLKADDSTTRKWIAHRKITGVSSLILSKIFKLKLWCLSLIENRQTFDSLTLSKGATHIIQRPVQCFCFNSIIITN